jgi:hypothetical protein
MGISAWVCSIITFRIIIHKQSNLYLLSIYSKISISITKTPLLVFMFSFFIAFLIGLSSLAIPLNYNTESKFPLHNALAQPAVINPNASNTDSRSIFNNTDAEETVLRQGVILSSQSGQNDTSQVALILPHRPDGKIYTGVLTYSASRPVEVGLLNRVFVDNDTLSQIKSSYGESIPNWIDNASAHHNLGESATQIISGIKPDYGTSTPYYSASIPFVASSVGLWSPVNEPFLVSYQISAKLGQPEVFNDFNATNFTNQG